MADARQTVLDAVSKEELHALVRRMYEKAMAGDAAVQKVLLAYLVGKPAEVVNPDRADLDEMLVLLGVPAEVSVAHNKLPPPVALEVLRSQQAQNLDEAWVKIVEVARRRLQEAMPWSRLDLMNEAGAELARSDQLLDNLRGAGNPSGS
jgi:hypothetical protein